MKEEEMLFLREEELKARHRIQEVMVAELHPTLLGIERVVIIFLVGRWMKKVALKRKFNKMFHDYSNWSHNTGRILTSLVGICCAQKGEALFRAYM